MRSPEGSASLPFFLLVLLAVLALACGAPPPAIETVTAAPAGVPSSGGGQPEVVAGSNLPGDGPRAVALDPPAGATGVDPARTSLSVTFDREMDREGWAWVTESPETAPEIAESHWDASLRIHTAHVTLAPGTTYVVWLNSPSYLYFRDAQQRPLEPIRWTFSTAAMAPPSVDTVPSH